MGGFGTWELIQRHPDRFAAAVPICGGGDAEAISIDRRAKSLPIWAFHGADDPVVNVRRSQAMIDASRAAGNAEAKLTIYPGVGHNSWEQTYNDPAMWRWLLSQRRARPTTTPTTTPTTPTTTKPTTAR